MGIDDKNVYAIADGIIDDTPYEAGGFGYYVRQKLPDGRRIYYGHLQRGSICVSPGQTVRRGDKLGIMGMSGRSTGKHTHLEIRVPGTSKQSLDICEFTGIPNAIGTYEVTPPTPEEAAMKIQEKCGFEDATMEYLKGYKFADSLFVKLWQAME